MERLSPETRLRIFHHAGLRKGRSVILNPGDGWAEYRWPRLPSLQVYCSLILVCKYISNEVVAAFYSQNPLAIRILQSSDFTLLQNLRPSTIRAVTSLTVHLNTTTCLARCNRLWPKPDEGAPLPLSLDDVERADLLPTWKAAMSRFLSHIVPNRLSLEVVCDCEDFATAEEATAPLFAQNQAPLRNCAVRLSRWRDTALCGLAERAALASMHRLPPSSTPFRFLDLPREVRLQILQYTDLVTPLREATWDPKGTFDIVYGFDECPRDEDEREAANDYFRENETWMTLPLTIPGDDPGNPNHCTWRTHYACRFRWHKPRYTYGGCFCLRYHSAWSSILDTCSLSLAPLFGVSRAFREDALAVFYTSNHIVQAAPDRVYRAATVTPPRADADIFLRDVLKASALHHLRFLELMFPPFDYDYMRPDEPAYNSWVETLALVKPHLSLPALTLRVCMSDHWPNGYGVTRFRVYITPEQVDTVIEAYWRILLPLRQLDGLKRLFIHLAWPSEWKDKNFDDDSWQARRKKIDSETEALEQRIEKEIVGPDYDSNAAGKRETPKNEWRKRIEAGASWAGADYPVD